MSVLQRPGILGRRTQNRVTGLTAAFSVTIVEALTVSAWFALVVFESRTPFTALAGLSILLFGAVLRTGILATTVGRLENLTPSRRTVSAIVFAGSWPCWLLVAEGIGGPEGLIVAGAVLSALLSAHCSLERRFVRSHTMVPPRNIVPVPRTISALVPGLLLAAGASTLLAVTWYADWSVVTFAFPTVAETVALEIRSVLAGFAAFACFSFVAQERRFAWLHSP
ncbi:hypothetical protein ACFQGT_08805 [Natrialbaceae archaeon GCM10025810]|uniref:hypothetical protein n=1 Tax=Halovalidus salilacus TaxID=3075124 RepID=UPI00361B3D2F